MTALPDNVSHVDMRHVVRKMNPSADRKTTIRRPMSSTGDPLLYGRLYFAVNQLSGRDLAHLGVRSL
jgi:hypothetical protein